MSHQLYCVCPASSMCWAYCEFPLFVLMAWICSLHRTLNVCLVFPTNFMNIRYIFVGNLHFDYMCLLFSVLVLGGYLLYQYFWMLHIFLCSWIVSWLFLYRGHNMWRWPVLIFVSPVSYSEKGCVLIVLTTIAGHVWSQPTSCAQTSTDPSCLLCKTLKMRMYKTAIQHMGAYLVFCPKSKNLLMMGVFWNKVLRWNFYNWEGERICKVKKKSCSYQPNILSYSLCITNVKQGALHASRYEKCLQNFGLRSREEITWDWLKRWGQGRVAEFFIPVMYLPVP
jgi:hypothetical protein